MLSKYTIPEFGAVVNNYLASFFGQHVRGIVAEMSALAPEEQDELGRLCRKVDLRDSSTGQT